MTYDEALRKAMACLRLSKSSNAHEAALAAAKAQEIITNYKLDVTNLDYDTQSAKEDSEPVKDFGNDYIDSVLGGNYEFNWCARLSSVIARVNQCRQYRTKMKKGGYTKIVGRQSDVATVRYMYAYLKGEVKRLLSEHGRGAGERFRYEFCLGVVEAIYAKLEAQQAELKAAARAAQSTNPLALVRVNGAIARIEKRALAVAEFMAGIGLRPGRSSGGATIQTGGRELGRQVGQSIRIGSAKAGLGSGTKQIS